VKPKKMVDALHQRIVEARESAGFSITEAAQKLGFKNYQTLSSIEKGSRNISANELIEMARLYARSLDYFFNQEVSTEPLPLWRKKEKSNVTKEQRLFLSFLEKYSNLENLLDLKRRWTEIRSSYDRDDFKNDGFAVADKLGQDIHKKLDLGSRPACNLLNVLENNLRFKIIHLPLQEDASAASIVDDNLGVGIVININEVPWRRNYDLAHELFHIVTWNIFSPGEIGDGTKKTKPEQEIKKVDIIELAKDFGVSTEAILWRLVNLKKLKKPQAQKILDDSSFRDLDRTLRRELHEEYKTSRLPARYISLACRCLVEGKISRGTFAEYLEINRADVDDCLVEMGFAEENYEKIAVA